MKIVILTENVCNLYGLKAEAGLSFYLEDEDLKILFDAGCSNVFLENASKLDIDLNCLDYVVLSHGHHDHIGGLEYLAPFYESKADKPVLIMHPLGLSERFKETGQIGIKFLKDSVEKAFNIEKTKEPFWINDNLVFLGEIDRELSFEGNYKIGKIIIDGSPEDDYMIDDSALALKTSKGLVVITGCSHSGVCNIVEQAKKVCNCDEIRAVIGGFHLKEGQEEQIRETVNYFKKLPECLLYSCHCTDQYAKFILKTYLKNIREISVGDKLEFIG